MITMKTKQQDIKISGVQKTSLIDYPEHIVAVIFTQGCNFTCPYCHNPELIANKNDNNKYVNINLFFEYLEKRRNLLDGVSITGGEPLLHDGLHKFIKEVKVKDFKVKLDTNGSQPEKLQSLLNDNLLDYIAMDVKLPFSSYNLVLPGNRKNTQVIHNIKKSISLILNSGLKHEFRTTVVPGMHEIKDIQTIARSIKGTEKYYLQNFRPINTLKPEMQKLHRFPPAVLKDFKNAAEKILPAVEIEIRD